VRTGGSASGIWVQVTVAAHERTRAGEAGQRDQVVVVGVPARPWRVYGICDGSAVAGYLGDERA
jgi:hypothetical protein